MNHNENNVCFKASNNNNKIIKTTVVQLLLVPPPLDCVSSRLYS